MCTSPNRPGLRRKNAKSFEKCAILLPVEEAHLEELVLFHQKLTTQLAINVLIIEHIRHLKSVRSNTFDEM